MFRRWTSPEAVFESLKEVTRGQPCDITGIQGYDMLEREGGVQWPLADAQASSSESQIKQERRLFEPLRRRAGIPERRRGALMYENIVVGYDGSEYSKAALSETEDPRPAQTRRPDDR